MLARVQGMAPEARAEAEAFVAEYSKDAVWIPTSGPQADAYRSPADLLLYGGAGGGGKTDLVTGYALTAASRSLIMRPQYTDLGGIIERFEALVGTRNWNKSPPAQLKYDGRLVDFGAASTLDQAKTWQGRPHDFIALDEACLFMEAVVRFLLGWNRSAEEELGAASTQRSRTILATNPPLDANGEWIIGMFRPWLDTTYSNPAEHGELRWFITDPDGNDQEVDDATPLEIDGRKYTPKSRTFIPAALSDNPFLVDTGYQATLDAMPEPLRSAIRDGNFMAGREDDAMQVIPTNWVLLSNERWREGKPKFTQQTAIGLDVARGGKDDTVFAPRYEGWFDELTVVPGRQTPDGPSVAVLAAGMLRSGSIVGIDSVGIGADAETALRNAEIPFDALNGAAGATAHTRDGNFGFQTFRSEMWWMLREALDPDYGFDIALPPDPALQADLTAPTYEVRPGTPPKIYVEAKKDMMRRLGRSPDRGDAVVYAWAAGGMELNNRKDNRRNQVPLHTPEADSDYDTLRY
jgi:hypothetical protein